MPNGSGGMQKYFDTGDREWAKNQIRIRDREIRRLTDALREVRARGRGIAAAIAERALTEVEGRKEEPPCF